MTAPAPVLLKGSSVTTEQAIAKYGNAQGNILKGHGRTHSLFLFVEFEDPHQAKFWLKDLLTKPSGQGGITSTAQQLLDRQAFNITKQDAGVFASLLLTAAGITLFGGTLPPEAADQLPGQHNPSKAFAHGMRDVKGRGLHDPKPAAWEKGWFTGDTPNPIHALLLLAADSRVQLEAVAEAAKAELAAAAARVHVQETGKRLLVAGHDIEHFGYADGVSQPLYLADDRGAATPHLRDRALGAEQLVLLPDPLCQEAGTEAWGSFMVFRKLAQDVSAFNEEEDTKLVKALELPDPSSENTKSFAGAMVVGRFENGTPLLLHGMRQDNNGEADFTNDFTYESDPDGLKCPFHAHIRKMNPRGETGDPVELHHRITRRGVPYGTRAEAEAGKPAGLLFVCYQRNIEQQFEFLQQSWANDAGFLHPLAKPGLDTGLDPVIGQGHRHELTFPTTWGWPATAEAEFPQHVFLKGGEYFYAPSINGLAALAGVPTPALVRAAAAGAAALESTATLAATKSEPASLA